MRINEEQLKLVDRQVKRLVASNNFYGAKLKEAGIESVGSVEDFLNLPFSHKQDLRDAYPLGLMAVPEEEIAGYVSEHIDVLESFEYTTNRRFAGNEEELAFIRDALGQDTIVKSVYRYSPDILQFYCGGSGIVTSSVYCGFYCSAKDEPFAMEFREEAQFVQTSEGVYVWKSDDNEREIYTARILPNWFYYYQRWD